MRLTLALVDIHSHILWDMDDGPAEMEQSIAMLQMATESGTTDIVATPHSNYRYRYEPEKVRERIAALAAAVPGGPAIHQGCEVHLSFDNVEAVIGDPRPFTINGGAYLLVEFPVSSIAGMGRTLGMLLERGLIPIVAHPERNPLLQHLPDDFLECVAQGCRAQITAQSLLGRFGKSCEKAGWEMLERGLAHFVASDGHGTTDRVPRLDEAYAAAAKRLGEDDARRWFIDQPRAVLRDERVEAQKPKPKRRWW